MFQITQTTRYRAGDQFFRQDVVVKNTGSSAITYDAFTMADICALTTVDFAKWIGLPVPEELAQVTAWRDRVAARPSARA